MNETVFQIAVDRLNNLIRPMGWDVHKTEKVDRGIEVIITRPAGGRKIITMEQEANRIVGLARAMGWESEGTEFSGTMATVWLKMEAPEVEQGSEEIST